MTTEFKIRCLRSKLSKLSSLGSINIQVTRAEQLGIPSQAAIEARNERAKELNFSKGNFGFRLG